MHVTDVIGSIYLFISSYLNISFNSGVFERKDKWEIVVYDNWGVEVTAIQLQFPHLSQFHTNVLT